MRYLIHGFAAFLLSSIAPFASAQGFSLAPLPYAHDALAPVIDEQTMRIHHGRHHQAYVDNLNKAVAASPALAGLTLEALLAEVSKAGDAVRNNGGGHWNHTFFWNSLKPGGGGAPTGAVAKGIDAAFGSLDNFKKEFANAAMTRLERSGWQLEWLARASPEALPALAA